MKRSLVFLAFLLAAALGGAAQTTTVTAASGGLKINGNPVNGNVTISSQGPVAVSGGGLMLPSSSSGYITQCAVSAGAIIGTCAVPSSTLSNGGNGALYTVLVTDAFAGMAQALTNVSISGSSWALDQYVPPSTVSTVAAFTYTTGSGAPGGGCSSTSLYADTSGSSLAFYGCKGGSWVSVGTAAGNVTLSAITALGTLTNSISGNAATATALAATPSQCSGESVPTGIDVHGNATGCFSVSAGTWNGGTVANPIVLPGDPTTGSQAATKRYVDYSPTFGGRVVYQQSTWANLSDFTVDSSNVTAAVSGGRITLSGTSASLNGYIALNASQSSDEDVDFEVTFQLMSAPGASTNGISIGKLSTNTRTDDQPDLAGWMNMYNAAGPTLQYLLGYGATFTRPGTLQSLGTIAQNDIIRLIYSQRGDLVTTICDDFTQGTRVTNQIYLAPHDGGISAPNMSKLAIWVQGGSYTILNMRAVSRQPVAPNLAVLGDSKTSCYGVVGEGLCYPDLIQNLGPLARYAGQGDMTAQVLAGLPYVLATNPKYVLIAAPYYNDVAEGVATATTEANYSSIVSQLKAAGISVVHMITPPNNVGVNTSTLDAWVRSTFASDPIIDPTVGWSNASYLSSDNIHPNAAGYAYIASLIENSGYISARASAELTPILPTAAQYPSSSASFNGGTVTNPIVAPTLSAGNGGKAQLVAQSGSSIYNMVSLNGASAGASNAGLTADSTGVDKNLYINVPSGGAFKLTAGGTAMADGTVAVSSGALVTVQGAHAFIECTTSTCTVDALSELVFNIYTSSTITLPTCAVAASTSGGSYSRHVRVFATNGANTTVAPPSGYTLYGAGATSTSSVAIASGHSADFDCVNSGGYENWFLTASY